MQIKQVLKLSQQLTMTPQLQQAIKLLQLSRLELNETIQQEMLENPILEEQTDADTDRIREDGTEMAAGEPPQSTVDGVIGERLTSETSSDREKSDHEDSTDWESFVEGYGEYAYSPGAGGVRMNQDDLPSVEQTLSEKDTLFDHLMWQLSLSPLSEQEIEVATDIIGNVDNDGYFVNASVEELAENHGVSVDFVEDVLTAVQEMDPVGVAARDLRECLTIQARTFHPGDAVMRKIIERHMGHLERRNYAAIQKDLGISEEELFRIAKTIGQMEPKPGRMFQSEETQYVTPDVYVQKVGDDYLVTLNEDGMPKLKVSNYYKGAMGDGSGKTKDYIQEKFRSAVWLIRSIHQRQNTIRKVTESIVRFQREFMDYGSQHLKPLILRDVADDIGMHESTVSRVTTSKYVHTPQGIFELKYFFNSRIQGRGDQEDLASEAVRTKIKQIITGEEPKSPLSDQAIADILTKQNIDIARRTVAKYREAMGILPSSQRKRLF
jgi:RNA polymerase sigma-54 factor